MERLLSRLEMLSESIKMGGFGGKAYYWPDVGNDWEDVDQDYDADGNGVIGIKYQNTGKHSFLFVYIDAREWLFSDGEKPVKYNIMFTGDRKVSGTIGNPSKSEIARLLNKAQSIADNSIKKIKSQLPSFKGWEKSYSSGVITYMSGYDNVEFDDVDTVLFGGGRGDVFMSVGGMESGGKWGGLSDIKKFIKKAESIKK